MMALVHHVLESFPPTSTLPDTESQSTIMLSMPSHSENVAVRLVASGRSHLLISAVGSGDWRLHPGLFVGPRCRARSSRCQASASQGTEAPPAEEGCHSDVIQCW